MDFRPSLDEFLELASHGLAGYTVVPVWVEVLADRETPVTAYEKLVGSAPGFLLESVEGGERWARWSFVGWDPHFTVRSHDGVTTVDDPGIDLVGDDPLQVLDHIVTTYTDPGLDGLPPLHTGLVGYLGYDCIRYVEQLGDRPPDDRGLPEMLWQFVGSLAAIDRFRHTIVLIRTVIVGADPAAQYREAVERLRRAADRLSSVVGYEARQMPGSMSVPTATSTMSRSEFEDGVRTVKRLINDGEAFQVVLSQRLETPFEDDPFDVYRSLRLINPSPFLFFIRDTEVTVAGSSPELMTRVRDGIVFSRPIAGTRPRGKSVDDDRAMEEELLADPKERAEHVMLIDLARNDLGRVCEFGSVTIDDLMVIERYSHVMHIVSGVSGKIRSDVGPVDVIRATFPHGTVSGAPKVRAMEIIDQLEPTARGPYAGAVGYLDFSGNVDTCICLRTVLFSGGLAWVQAGAGLVADSEPAVEFDETMNKAAAAFQAIAMARQL